MSLPVFSELLQGQEGIKSIYALHFQANIHDRILECVRLCVCVCACVRVRVCVCVCVFERERNPFSGSFPCNKTRAVLKRVFNLFSSYEANPGHFDPLNCMYLVTRLFVLISLTLLDFADGSDGKESTCNAGDLDSIPGLGRSPQKGKATHSGVLA